MSEKKVGIVDCEISNTHSIEKAFKAVGADPFIVSSPGDMKRADFIVLPGVGTFKEGMKKLEEKNLVGAIKEYVQSNRAILGICLGMQLLFEESEEFGFSKGLELIPGRVISMRSFNKQSGDFKLPHIGWKKLFKKNGRGWDESFLSNTEEGAEVYFVHSFVAKPKYDNDLLAVTFNGEHEICAAIKKGNIFGCQFHPEKSGKVGLKMLETFISRYILLRKLGG